MTITKDEIIKKYMEFNLFLEEISIEELQKQYSRTELTELKKELYNLKLRSLPYDISKAVDKMKKEEYPELLGIHRYPELKEIDFITEEQKLELDKFLAKHRVGEYVSGLWRFCRDYTLVQRFLLEKKIVSPVFYVQCPHCQNNFLSEKLNKNQKETLDAKLKEAPSDDRYEFLERIINGYCDECPHEYDLETITYVVYKEFLILVKERDKSLDNA